MGLFSRITSKVGMLGTKASSLSGRFTKQISNIPFIGRASKFVLGGTRLARIATPVGGIIGAVSVAKFLSRVFPDPKDTPIQVIAKRNARLRSSRKDQKVKTTVEVAKRGGFLKKAIAIGALVAGGAFIGEQLAERAGVRGGAGFIGRRKVAPGTVSPRRKRRVKKRVVRRKRVRKRVARRKRVTHKSPRHKGHKRVSFTTKDGRKVNFLVRKKGGVSHKRRRRKKA